MSTRQVFLFLLLIHLSTSSDLPDRGISRQQLENWASKFGGPLAEFARSVTKYNELHLRFQQSRDSDVSRLNLQNILELMKANIQDHFKERIKALYKLQENVEQRALSYNVKGPSEEPRPYNYFSAKRLNREPDEEKDEEEEEKWPYPTKLDLRYSPHFNARVNFSTSSVHVPTSIYERDKGVLQGLEWSSDLDDIFIQNLKDHPTLHWQYFGSASGFLRQYPAMQWRKDNKNGNTDLFDSRMRPWYTTAANSPKNIVILQDASGSMTGRRREIARHVVYTILDTLTDNDYVNVYSFSGNATPIVPCFHDKLVEASLENIREFKVALDQDSTQNMADHASAIRTAFELLNTKLNDTDSSGCNQAIMLITDGSPYYYEDLFKSLQNPMHPVRIFTYLIGKEVTDFREVRWMACTNQGYFVHVSTLGEVQEQVLKYLPIMSRPMVIYGKHDVTWTPIYANFVEKTSPTRSFWLIRRSLDEHKEMVESDWAWAAEIGSEQRSLSEKIKINRSFRNGTSLSHINFTAVPPHRTAPMSNEFEFVVSVSLPVFDLRNKITTEDGKKNNETGTKEERIANFLGVVGTDVPLKELKRLTTPFKLGVNGYAFIVTNNGHVVLHPNWRPAIRSTHGDILKPNYNSVDLLEMELVDSNGTFRNNDSMLLQMRHEIVMKDKSFRNLRLRIPQEDFKRVTIRNQAFEFDGIDDTPYTLGITVPERANWFRGEIEVMRIGKDEGIDVTHYLDPPNDSNRKWTINPNWHYCDYIRSDKVFANDEDRLIHFLREIQTSSSNWRWRNTGVGINKNVRHSNKRHLEEDIYECDRELVQSLIFDANVTDVFTSTSRIWKFNKNESKIIEIYGALLAFIATRSGLTRWIEFERHHENNGNSDGGPPIDRYATESLWYQRAVDRYEIDPNSFVYSVPINSGVKAGNRVTATRAIFVTKHGRKAPVAVVGIQFEQKKWSKSFLDITGTCMDGSDCKKTCTTSEFDCYVLDDNGYILIATRNEDNIGKYFGEVDGMVMDMLVNADVYRRVRVYDFQAACPQLVSLNSPANYLLTPLYHLKWFFSWFFSHLVYIALNWNTILAEVLEEIELNPPSQDYPTINKTKLNPCDKEYDLVTYGSSYNSHNFNYNAILNKCGPNCDGYFNIHYIPHTNLILVVTDGRCQCGHNVNAIAPRIVTYEAINATDELCRIPRPPLVRRKPEPCYNFNPEEKELLEDCGKGSKLEISSTFQQFLFFLLHFYFVL